MAVVEDVKLSGETAEIRTSGPITQGEIEEALASVNFKVKSFEVLK